MKQQSRYTNKTFFFNNANCDENICPRLPQFRNKRSLPSIVIALRTQHGPRDSMTVLFLSILILASLQLFCFWMEWPTPPPPANSFQPTVELYSCSPAAADLLIPAVMMCTMFSFVPERTERIYSAVSFHSFQAHICIFTFAHSILYLVVIFFIHFCILILTVL